MAENYPLFATAFAVSALGGLAALLRSKLAVSRKNVAAYTLNTGVAGLALSLLWFQTFHASPELLVGLCVVVGLSGMVGVEFVMDAAKRFTSALTKKENDSA